MAPELQPTPVRVVLIKCNLLFQIQWADACLLVYSVTDRSSFEYAQEILNTLKKTPTNGSPAHGPAAASPGMPLALLGNKTDLDHLRQVRIPLPCIICFFCATATETFN